MSETMKAKTVSRSRDDGAAGLNAFERDQIRRRAHAIWWEEGCPQGRDRELWARAELEVLKTRPHM